MASCQDPDVIVRSPNAEAAIIASATVTAAALKVIQTSRLDELDPSEVRRGVRNAGAGGGGPGFREGGRLDGWGRVWARNPAGP